MPTNVKRVFWSAKSRKQLQFAHEYINRESPKNANKVRDDIIAISNKLSIHPEIYSLDKYKIDNDGSYRAFEKHRYRVAYRILKDSIRILRVRHTGMEPLFY